MKFRLQGITDLSTIDWPGKLAAVVYLQGCDLRCPWCQNVDGVDPRGGKEASTEEVVEHVKGLRPVVDSVVITGGEPLLQPKACSTILKAVKELGMSCAIETNGNHPRALRPLFPYLQLAAVDVKAPLGDPELYLKTTGSTTPELVRRVRESLMLAMNSGVEVEIRTTIVPTLNDREEVIERLVDDIKGVNRLRLQQFRNRRTFDPTFQKLPMPGREKLLKLASVAKRKGMKNVKIYTADEVEEAV